MCTSHYFCKYRIMSWKLHIFFVVNPVRFVSLNFSDLSLQFCDNSDWILPNPCYLVKFATGSCEKCHLHTNCIAKSEWFILTTGYADVSWCTISPVCTRSLAAVNQFHNIHHNVLLGVLRGDDRGHIGAGVAHRAIVAARVGRAQLPPAVLPWRGNCVCHMAVIDGARIAQSGYFSRRSFSLSPLDRQSRCLCQLSWYQWT